MDFGNLIGQVVDGKYRIERQLGKGGMGAVYLAMHVGTERPVAVKVIVPQYMERAEFIERFRREARAAGRLRHPNVVDVTDFGIAEMEFGRVAYLVMEYLDGCTLGEVLDEEKQLPLSWTLDILQQVCSAVHEAHEQGIIHRDLKPDNIWLEPNQRGGYTVKVLDFGIAKLEEPASWVSSGEGTGFAGATETVAGARATLIASERVVTLGGESVTAVANSDTEVGGEGTIAERGTAIMPADGERPGSSTVMMNPGEVDTEAGTAVFDSRGGSEDDTIPATAVEGAGTVVAGSTGRVSASELTRVGSVLGTPLYMSPEQCRGEKLTPRSDIYSLGVIAYQMLSGRTPFEGDFTAVMEAHKELQPPRLEARKIPKKVKRVVHHALSKDQEERPQTAQALAAKLQANSEGIGSLLTRTLTLFSERLPVFLQIALFVSIPAILLAVVGAVFNFLVTAEVIAQGTWTTVFTAVAGVTGFFVQLFTAAILVGVTTWVVAKVLAVPLRPISLRTAFARVRERWKMLVKSVTVSTFAAFLGWILGGIAGGIAGGIIGVPLYFFVSQPAAFILGGFVMVIGSLAGGIGVSASLMLVAPVVMMEGLKTFAAIKRSFQLVKRAFRTVVAVALLSYFLPATLGGVMVMAINGMFYRVDPAKPAAVIDQKEATAGADSQNSANRDLKLQVNPRGIGITEGDRDAAQNKDTSPEAKAKTLRKALAEAIFQIFWAPVTIIIAAFTSIISALLYLGTRLAGGESMQELLGQFEDSAAPKPKWQERVEERLIQSGKITSKP